MNVITPGDRVRALRQLLGWTQDKLATASGIARTKIVEIETGANAATTWRIRKGLADAVGVRVEAVVGRLRDRPEWPAALAATQAAAAAADPDLTPEDFDRAGTLYDGAAIPVPLTPRFVLQLCRILRP